MAGEQPKLEFWRERLLDAACVALWIFLSATLVFYNKFLLSFYGFHFPITLTLWHMLFCSGMAAACVSMRVVQPLEIPLGLYWTKILPIAACYAGALWSSNEAYSIISVSFAQMVKAGMPVTVFLTAMCFGVERFRLPLFLDILLITFGVGVSAYGEAHLVVKGLVLLVVSMSFDAIRLTLTQQMMQDSGIKFSPLTTLYYIAPAASFFLSIPFVLIELRHSSHFLAATNGAWHFVLNGANAFGLNLAVYLLIGRTSALTMNVCGLIKDWFTISGSVFLFGSVVTVTNIVGYSIAFIGVGWYNYLRMPSPAAQSAALDKALAGGKDPTAAAAPGHPQHSQQQQQHDEDATELQPLLSVNVNCNGSPGGPGGAGTGPIQRLSSGGMGSHSHRVSGSGIGSRGGARGDPEV